MERKRIAVKYCGGCNLTYDRIESIQKISSENKNQFQLIPYGGDSPMDAILFISRCPKACATRDFLFFASPTNSVSTENDLRNLMEDSLPRSK